MDSYSYVMGVYIAGAGLTYTGLNSPELICSASEPSGRFTAAIVKVRGTITPSELPYDVNKYRYNPEIWNSLDQALRSLSKNKDNLSQEIVACLRDYKIGLIIAE